MNARGTGCGGVYTGDDSSRRQQEALVPGMGSQVQSSMSETGVAHGSSLACKTSGAIGVSDLGRVRAVASGHHLPTRRGIRVQVP